MTLNDNEIICYSKPVPKWVGLIVLAVGTTGALFIPTNSSALYILVGLCSLFLFKTFTQKPEVIPVLTIGTQGVQIAMDEFYPYTEIEKVLAFSEKRMRFRSVNFKLYLKEGKQVEFCVDNLTVKPQRLLDAINEKIKL